MSNIPRAFTQGDRIEWTDSFTNYLPALYTLKHILAGSTKKEIVSTANGNNFLSVLTTAESLLLPVGKYSFQAVLTRADNQLTTISVGQIDVRINLTEATLPIDTQSYAEKQLALAQTAYSEALRASRLKIGDRETYRQDIDTLLAQIQYWERAVARANSTSANPSYLKVGY